MRCYICDNPFNTTTTNYPDGKNPCPSCVEEYKLKPSDETIEEGELDTADLEPITEDNFRDFNLPVEDYYDQ